MLAARCFQGHALVFHKDKGWESQMPMDCWVRRDLLHLLHISSAKSAFEGCLPLQAQQQVPTSSLGT